MKTIQIPKRSGGTRTICVPSGKRKRTCRDLIPELQKIVRQVCDMSVVHGFAELRSPVTNAAKHIGYQYTLSFDLADFFDSVKQNSMKSQSGWPTDTKKTKCCWHEGVARQGLPTSPIVANIAAAEMDKTLKAESLVDCYVYTRYADDLTFSYNNARLTERLLARVPQFVAKHGFQVNPRKTRLQWAGAGRRIITGVAVDDTGIYPTRAAKRRLRAAIRNAKTGRVKHFPSRQWTRYAKTCKHHGRPPMSKQAWLKRWLEARVRGLVEWCQLKPPNVGKRSALRIAEAARSPADALIEIGKRTANL